MSGLAHSLEAQGIATVIIGLIPQHVRTMKPPRALLVPFELGRPLGAPNDPDLQRSVLSAALALLDRPPPAPVHEFFPAEPLTTGDEEIWACPVSFPAASSEASLENRLLAEINLLTPWFDQGKKSRGHTTTGVSGLDAVATGTWLCEFLETNPPTTPPITGQSIGETFKLAAEDLKAFYLEAVTAQPGHASGKEINRWFWNETVAAQLLRQLRLGLAEHPDEIVRLHASFTLVPEAHTQG